MNLPVPPNSLEAAIQHIRSGKRLTIATQMRVTILDSLTLARFEKAGCWLLRADGDGYRMKTGKTSVYLFPGQLKFAD